MAGGLVGGTLPARGKKASSSKTTSSRKRRNNSGLESDLTEATSTGVLQQAVSAQDCWRISTLSSTSG